MADCTRPNPRGLTFLSSRRELADSRTSNVMRWRQRLTDVSSVIVCSMRPG